MASQEADGAELRAARAGEAPGRPGEAAAGGSSTDPGSENHPEVLQVLGVRQAPLVHFFKREGDDHPMGNLVDASTGISELLITGSVMWFKKTGADFAPEEETRGGITSRWETPCRGWRTGVTELRPEAGGEASAPGCAQPCPSLCAFPKGVCEDGLGGAAEGTVSAAVGISGHRRGTSLPEQTLAPLI